MILTKEVEIKLNPRTKNYYKDLGYDISTNPIVVKVEDLTKGSKAKIEIKCDFCEKIRIVEYCTYSKYSSKNNGDLCLSCSSKKVIKENNLLGRKGEDNPNWNPNKTDKEREIQRKYPEYIDFVKKVMTRDNYTCKCCGKHDSSLQVHHLNGYDWDIEHRIDDTNGITLCGNCHKNFHSIYGYGGNTKEQFEEWFGQAMELVKYEGELPTTKKVYCYEENKVYDSAEICAKELGLKSDASIRETCNHKQMTARNLHLFWYDEYLKMSKEEISHYISQIYVNDEDNGFVKKRSVVCITTNKSFKSIKEACKYYKIKSRSMISDCLRGRQKTTMGYLEDGTKVRLEWKEF